METCRAGKRERGSGGPIISLNTHLEKIGASNVYTCIDLLKITFQIFFVIVHFVSIKIPRVHLPTTKVVVPFFLLAHH